MGTAFQWLEGQQLETPAQLAANAHRSHEAHPVQAVVDAHAHIVDGKGRFEQHWHQAQRQKAMRHRCAERALRRPHGIGVYPLMVAGGLRKQVDASLVHRQPGTATDLVALSLIHI